jgi:hypothetical protein
MSAEPAQDGYALKSHRFLDQAKRELAAGDSVQASQKLWGAAAQMVKGVADRRRWPHRSHRNLYSAVGRLVTETGEEELGALFVTASGLHQNFYEQLMPMEIVQSAVSAIEQLVQKLESLA